MASHHFALPKKPDYLEIKQTFLKELTPASQEKQSSISFVKHTMPEKPLLTSGIIQGMVIGGTNFILSTEELHTDGTRNILERKTGILPTFTTKQLFVDFVIEHLDPKADAIGCNFGFKLDVTYGKYGELDGI